MVIRRATIFVLATSVAAAAQGCRGVEPEPPAPHSPAMFPEARTAPEWYRSSGGLLAGKAGDDLGPVDPKLLVQQDAALSGYTVSIEPEDTLDLYSKWTGQGIAKLLSNNPDARAHGLVAGDAFRLILSGSEFARFNGARKAYLATVRSRKEQGVEVLGIAKHEVREGETVRDLLGRYSTDLDLLEKLNPSIRLAGVRAGQVVNVPIVARPSTDLPGPRPPAPAPVPQPPSPQPPVTASAPKAPAEQPRSAPPSGREKTYTVEPGDTAWIVARKKLGVAVDDLSAANPGVDLARLRPGQRLKVPR